MIPGMSWYLPKRAGCFSGIILTNALSIHLKKKGDRDRTIWSPTTDTKEK